MIYFKVPSGSQKGHFWEVVGHPVRQGFSYTCSCPGFSYRHKCSHVDQVEYALFSAGPVVVVDPSTDPNRPTEISERLVDYEPYKQVQVTRILSGNRRNRTVAPAHDLGVDF